MTQSRLPFKIIALAAGDIAAAVLAIAAAPFLRHAGPPQPGILALYRFATPFLVTLWTLGFIAFGLYDLKAARNEPKFFERLGRGLVFNFVLTMALFYAVPEFRLRPLATLLIIFSTLSLLLAAWRSVYNAVLRRLARERVLFIGLTAQVVELSKFLASHPQLGFTPAGFLTLRGEERLGAAEATLPADVLPMPDNLADVLRQRKAGVVVIAHDLKRDPAIMRRLFPVRPLGVTITDFRHFYELVAGKVPVSLISQAWFIENLIGSRRPKYDFSKRILDLTLAAALGAAALLALPFIAAAILLSTPRDLLDYSNRRARPGDGIIFFRQPRVGKNGRVFNFLKFRSQVLGAERFSGEKTTGPDRRAYAVGTFLRQTYLDELPQIINVIRGEMSFVGPRPERPEFVSELEPAIPFYRTRELVLPGMTGWAQINMENDASVSDAAEKLQYDLYYIKNRSLALDAVIMLKTALKLLQRSGR